MGCPLLGQVQGSDHLFCPLIALSFSPLSLLSHLGALGLFGALGISLIFDRVHFMSVCSQLHINSYHLSWFDDDPLNEAVCSTWLLLYSNAWSIHLLFICPLSRDQSFLSENRCRNYFPDGYHRRLSISFCCIQLDTSQVWFRGSLAIFQAVIHSSRPSGCALLPCFLCLLI